MTGLEKLIEKIMSDAKDSAHKILEDANQKSDLINDEAMTKASEIEKAILDNADVVSMKIVRTSDSNANLDGRKYLLFAKQKIMNEVFNNALISMKNMEIDKYFELILKLIKKYATNQKGEVLLSQKDRERIPIDFAKDIESLGINLELFNDTCNIDGGFMLRYGGMEENCSFEAILKSQREELEDKIAKILFD